MKYIFIVFILFSIVVFADYKERLEVMDIPFQEASMMSKYTEHNGIALHAKVINNEEEKNFFNETLSKDGFVPILITVTNNSKDKITIYGANIVQKDTQKIELQTLLDKYQVGFLKGLKSVINVLSFGIQSMTPGGAAHEAENQGYDEAKKNNFNDKSIHTDLLYPGDTISGFVYFDKKTFDKSKNIIIPIQMMDSYVKEKIEINIQ